MPEGFLFKAFADDSGVDSAEEKERGENGGSKAGLSCVPWPAYSPTLQLAFAVKPTSTRRLVSRTTVSCALSYKRWLEAEPSQAPGPVTARKRDEPEGSPSSRTSQDHKQGQRAQRSQEIRRQEFSEKADRDCRIKGKIIQGRTRPLREKRSSERD